MSKNSLIKPLGVVLQQAGLVSEQQVKVALQDQAHWSELRLGEIMALRGWLKPETADFFAEQWPTLVSQKPKQPLGQYLKEAALLDEEQISAILSAQKKTRIRFGTLATLKGWIKLTTINFFVESLAPESKSNLGQNQVSDNLDTSLEPGHLQEIRAQILENRLGARKKSKTVMSAHIEPALGIEPFKKKKTIPNSANIILRRILVFLAIAGVFIVSLNIFLKRLEVKIFQQGNELFNQGKYQKAIAKYDELLNIDRNYYQAWTNRGYSLAGLGEYNQMLESCSLATVIESKAIYAWNCQGEALYKLKQYDEALAAFDKAIAVKSTDSVFWINKGESLLALKRNQEALEAIDQAVELLEQIKQVYGSEKIKEELSVALSYKGIALREKQQYEEALSAYDQALEYASDHFPAQIGRGIALKGLRRYDQASAFFDKILNNRELTDSQKAETWFYKGLTLCESLSTQQAIAAFEEALKLKPDYEAAEKAMSNCRK